jgi:hypothetical protein
MSQPYLEVTFRHGRAIAAYLYLPRTSDEKSASTRRVEPGMVIDFGTGGRPIGIEITAPSLVSLATLNRVLGELGLPPVTAADVSPLRAA